MGEKMEIEFTERGYRQLTKALQEAFPAPATTAPKAEVPDVELQQWTRPGLSNQGEAAYLDEKNMLRWVAGGIRAPKDWRPLLVAVAE